MSLMKAVVLCALSGSLGILVGLMMAVTSAFLRLDLLGWFAVVVLGISCLSLLAGFVLAIVDTVKDKNV
jgi:hypothetical protein